VARAEAQVRKRYDTSFAGPHKLVVDFGCDVAFPTVDEAVFEDGSGHGGTLRIVHMSRMGSTFAVRAYSLSHYYGPGLTLTAGTIPAPRLDALLARARVQMLARPHLIELQEDDGTGGSGGGSFSSNDFHLRLSLVDSAGRRTDRGFTGYESSDSQDERLPMEIASEPLITAIAALPMSKAEITEEDRRFFSERFLLTMQGAPEWWVKERYIAMGAQLGTISTIPALVRVAAEARGATAERQRLLVFDAVQGITGWDPRKSDAGTVLSSDEAARALAVECGT
jgi:hypothetical protein